MTRINHDKMNRKRAVQGPRTRKAPTTKAEQRNATALALAQTYRHRHPALKKLFRRYQFGSDRLTAAECSYIERTVKELRGTDAEA